MAKKCDFTLEVDNFEASLKEIADELSKEDLIVGSLILSDIIEVILAILGSFIAEYFRGKGTNAMESEYEKLKEWVMAVISTINSAIEKGEAIKFLDSEVGNFFVSKLLDEIETEVQKMYSKDVEDA